MSNSFAQAINLTCSQCRRSFDADVWLIVDVAEDPNLLEQIFAGTLHNLACPNCNYEEIVNAPLLIYVSDLMRTLHESSLLFSPAQATSAEEARKQLDRLLEILYDSLGSAWQDEWLQQITTVPRELLAAVLNAPSENVPGRMTMDVQTMMAQFLQESPKDFQQMTGDALRMLEELFQRDPQSLSHSDSDPSDALQAQFTTAILVGENRLLVTEFSDDLRQAIEADLRYQRTGVHSALDIAIAAWIRILKRSTFTAVPKGFQLFVLSDAGSIFLRRYWVLGQIEDLNQAVHLWQQAVMETPKDSSDLPSRLNNLGTGLRARYKHTGQIEDLNQAVSVYQQAVSDSPLDSSNLPLRLTHYGAALRLRYMHTKKVQDLEQAIGVYQRAVDLTPSDSPDLPNYLNNLGNGFNTRYEHTKQIKDLEQAISVYQQAAALIQPDSHYWPSTLSNLGNGLIERYERLGQWKDLEQAINFYQQAVDLTPSDSPDLPSRLNNLGTGLIARYAYTSEQHPNKSIHFLKQGTMVFERACRRGLEVAPEEALRSALNWGNWAMERHSWQEATQAYDFGLKAIDRLFEVQLVREAQESWLRTSQGLHARAAYALARIGQFEAAVTTIERGRGRLLAEALEQDRSDLKLLLTDGHSELYQRYRKAVERKQLLQSSEQESRSLQLTTFERSRALKAAEAELNAVIVDIQQVSGYEDFFAQPTFAQIQAVVNSHRGKKGNVEDAILVYLLVTPVGSLALIVHSGKVTPLWLDKFTNDQLTELLYGSVDKPVLGGWLGAYTHRDTDFQTWFGTIEKATRHLWKEIMGPLAEGLRNLNSRSEGSLRSVILIPTGLLSLLPLHAAWTDSVPLIVGEGQKGNPTRHYFLDEFVVSYTPSARALAHARTIANRVTSVHLLGIDEPQPVGSNALPNSAAEMAAVAELFTTPQCFSHRAATRAAVLAALPQAQVAHFSCHGGTNWFGPLESGLLMAHNERLTVHDLLKLRLPGARLATLSACETGIVGMDLPDEAVMLPTALVQAGFAGVVASLWSVVDISTAILMTRFYDYWKEDEIELAEALRMAQQWMYTTTNRQKREYFALIISGRSGKKIPVSVARHFLNKMDMLDKIDLRHPLYWAAFYLTGT